MAFAAGSAFILDAVSSGRLLKTNADGEDTHDGLRLPNAQMRTLSSGSQDQVSLTKLADGPYFIASQMLDVSTLCKTDATCRRLLVLNSAYMGPWHVLGLREFRGLELQDEGLFEPDEGQLADTRKLPRMHWKGRYGRFQSLLSTFSSPFYGSEITSVEDPDEVAYFQCRLRTDLIVKASAGIYLEVEVLQNADNLSMAVVDFEAGGCSSLTFSPDTGAVIQERKLVESPRKVEGAYIQPLPMLLAGERFLGLLGLYLEDGQVAFFRKSYGTAVGSREATSKTTGPWETTGFISNLKWAAEQQLTPCLAFRNQGAYKVPITPISRQPPLLPEVLKTPPNEMRWSGLEWEADQAQAEND